MTEKVTVPEIRRRKHHGPRIAMLTAYDATMARLIDAGGADVLLVGDSLGMAVQGHANTLPVTLDEMIYHSRMVARGTTRAMVAADLPFMSFQVSPERALDAAGRLVKEGNVEAVKLEGGAIVSDHVQRIVRAGIPVIGHLGLMPQSVHAMGGFRVQAQSEDEAQRLLEDAVTLEEAGVFAIVLEGIPAPVARSITESVLVPTIGIGAGPHCDGQVLVCYDFLGMTVGKKPRFVKHFVKLGEAISAATRVYVQDVQNGAFPDAAHSFGAGRRDPGNVEGQ